MDGETKEFFFYMYTASPSGPNRVSIYRTDIGVLSYNINLGSNINQILTIANGDPYFIVTCVDNNGNILNKKYTTKSGILSSTQTIGKQ